MSVCNRKIKTSLEFVDSYEPKQFKPSDLAKHNIVWIKDLQPEDIPLHAACYLRESNCDHDLLNQEKGLVKYVKNNYGIKIPKKFRFKEVAKGYKTKPEDRFEFVQAMETCKVKKLDLIVPVLSRVARSQYWHAVNNRHIKPSSEELDSLLSKYDNYNVKIIILHDPNTSPSEDEEFLRQLKFYATGIKSGPRNKGGRPKVNDKTKNTALPLILDIKATNPRFSGRKIAEILEEQHGIDVSHTSIIHWLKQSQNSVKFS